MDNHTRDLMFSSENEEYGTPQELFDKLDAIHHFDLDVCASDQNHKCEQYYTRSDNGLAQEWHKVDINGRSPTCWMNPPYGKPENPCVEDEAKCTKKGCKKRGYHIHEYRPGQVDWIKKAWEESRKGCTVVCLLPARTDTTEIFHAYIWDAEKGRPRSGVCVDFVKGRLQFEGAKDPAPFPSMIVEFSPYRRRGRRTNHERASE